jgi:NADH-quinone oxidoreductase E subunit
VTAFTKDNLERARSMISRYPEKRSALIPLLHLAQEQEGWITKDAMREIATLLDITPAEVLGTCSFYEMFKREPVGKYLINVCTNVSCMLLGAYELLDQFEQKLGVTAGSTTQDGEFTLQEVECVAACTQAPCALVNYRTFGPLAGSDAELLVDDLRAGRLANDVPPHGTTTRIRQVTR